MYFANDFDTRCRKLDNTYDFRNKNRKLCVPKDFRHYKSKMVCYIRFYIKMVMNGSPHTIFDKKKFK